MVNNASTRRCVFTSEPTHKQLLKVSDCFFSSPPFGLYIFCVQISPIELITCLWLVCLIDYTHDTKILQKKKLLPRNDCEYFRIFIHVLVCDRVFQFISRRSEKKKKKQPFVVAAFASRNER